MKRLAFAIIAVLLLYSWATAQTTAPAVRPVSIRVRDTDTKVDTAATLTPAGTLYLSQLPKAWTLDFDFALTNGHTVTVDFSLDAQRSLEFQQPPYCPNGHNSPLNIPVGPHTVYYSVNGIPQPSVTFSLANAPPVTQPATQATYGWNWIGMNWPACDPAVHPQILTLHRDTNATWARLWIEETAMNAAIKSGKDYFAVPKRYAAAKIKVFAVWQFQSTDFKPPTDAQLIARAATFPRAVDAGINSIGFNECSSKTYFNGSLDQLRHVVQILAPPLHAKGYQVVAPSFLNDLAACKSYEALGGYDKGVVDGVDAHLYYATADQVVTQAHVWVDYARQFGLSIFISEWGTRQASAGNAAWAQQQAVAIRGMSGFDAVIMPFSAIYAGDSQDEAFPLNSDYTGREPFHSAYVAAMGSH